MGPWLSRLRIMIKIAKCNVKETGFLARSGDNLCSNKLTLTALLIGRKRESKIPVSELVQ